MTEETSPPWGGYAEMGPLAAALAKAQAAYPPIPRDKEVTVQMKSGGSYKFKYAPLDTILAAVRAPLSDNGLAIAQLLDGPDLVTLLLHESGASLSARVKLPGGGDVQALGSAITYLRRYALQALLGIAAEEDDDGNAASGNRATPTRRPATAAENLAGRPQPDAPPAFSPSDAELSGLIGTAEMGKSDADFSVRQVSTPDRPQPFPRIAFRLSEGRHSIKVEALDSLAEQIAEYRQGIEGFRVTCWGRLRDETFTPKTTDGHAARPITYQILTLSRLKVGALELTGASEEPEAASGELFPEPVPA